MFDREDVRRIYVSQLGEPARVATFHDETVAVDTLKWEPSQIPRLGVHLYVTLGASRISAGAEQHRVEFYLGLDHARDDVAPILAEFAAEPIVDDHLLEAGHSVTFPVPIWKGAQFRTLLVFHSGQPPIPDAALPDGSHLSLRGLVPLHQSELEEKKRVGFDEFWSRLAMMEAPVTDPIRPSTVPGNPVRRGLLARLRQRR